jgi:hypothetical protein
MLSTKQNSGRRFGVRHARRRHVSAQAVNVEQLKSAKKAFEELVRSRNCAPILVRLGAQLTVNIYLWFLRCLY